MEDLFSGMSDLIWSLAGTAVLGTCGWIIKRGSKFFKEHTTNNQVAREHPALKQAVEDIKKQMETQSRGLCTVLRALMVNEQKRLVKQHYATPDEKDHFEDMYVTYNELGGNGTGTSMYEDVMHMYTMAPTGEEGAKNA